MSNVISSAARVARRRPLAACVASVFALAAPAVAIAETWVVNTCDQGSSGDDTTKTGTLRYALSNALGPAIIDLTGLTACPNSKITLTTGVTGGLPFNQDDITINGPGAGTLQIDATGLGLSYGDKRAFTHYGFGKLTINNLGVTGGHAYHGNSYASLGGCIFSNGTVELNGVTVSTCYTRNVGSNAAKGGAIYAKGKVTLINSTVSGNYARSVDSDAFGGGVYARGDVTLASSSVLDSGASSVSGHVSGAGLFALGDATLSAVSLVSLNEATSTDGFATGGGLYAKGGAEATDSLIGSNKLTSTHGQARGGGVYTKATLKLTNSVLSHNAVNGGTFADGGGASAIGGLSTAYSTIDDNHASAPGGSAFAGGVYSSGNATLTGSTVSNNGASKNIGGLNFFGGEDLNKTVTLTNSTISGNSASGVIGGLYADAKFVNISNSTIAFNTAGAGTIGVTSFAPGVAINPKTSYEVITLQSSILSNNTYGSAENDLSAGPLNPAVSGGNNLIRAASANVPPATISGCPLLGPLRDNGGLTWTHALSSTSPAIDAGNSIVVDDYDQRGSAATNNILDYVRISGPIDELNPNADIGAYEVQQNNIIFNNAFDSCIELI